METEMKFNIKNCVQSHLELLEDYIKTYFPNIKGSDFVTLIDIIYMATVRYKIDIPVLLKDLYNGIFDKDKFYKANNGNVYNFINPKYKLFAKRITHITIGSNGGMANVGKGEWLISLSSGINPDTKKPYVTISKDGTGDTRYNSKNEELKWNGGKVSVEKEGKLVQEKFNKLLDISDKKWVPFRGRKDKKLSEEVRNNYNAKYWEAISGEKNSSLTNDELKKNIINMCFVNVFEKSDTFIMFNDNGNFQRFYNLEEANSYYSDKLDLLKGTNCGFECRANQNNPIALYCYVF